MAGGLCSNPYWGMWRRIVRLREPGATSAGRAVTGRRRRSIVAPVWSEDEMSSDDDDGELTDEQRRYTPTCIDSILQYIEWSLLSPRMRVCGTLIAKCTENSLHKRAHERHVCGLLCMFSYAALEEGRHSHAMKNIPFGRHQQCGRACRDECHDSPYTDIDLEVAYTDQQTSEDADGVCCGDASCV